MTFAGIRLTARSELPNIAKFSPGRDFRLKIFAAAFPWTSSVFSHLACCNVLEKTILENLFIRSAIIGSSLSADAVGH
jgi:hypothetical protein